MDNIANTVNNIITEQKILVTGGAGFIGSNISKYLLENGVKFLRIVDNLSTGNLNNIQPLLNKYNNIEFVWGDITDLDTCREVCRGIDLISHQAALGSVPRSINNPLKSHDSNVNGFLNILQTAKENGIKRIVYASSSSVYGDNENLPKVEREIGKQLSPYAITKYVNELYAQIFTDIYGLECIGLRYFNVFGPNQNPSGEYAAVIPKFIRSVLDNKRPIIYGDGTYSRDFTYVDNVVLGNVLALTISESNTDKLEQVYGQVFNIGGGGRVTINELFETIKSELNSDINPIYLNVRKGDIPHSNADISKAKKILNYDPIIDFKNGMKHTINYFKKK